MGRKNLVDALDFGRDYVRAVNLNRPEIVNSFSTIFAVIDTSHLQPEAQTQTISISGLVQSAINDGLLSGIGGVRPPLVDDGSNTPPTIYPELGEQPESSLLPGDMWVDANGALHIYYNNRWNKVSVYSDSVFPDADPPPQIITPNGEIFVHQKQYNEWIYTRTDRRPIIDDSAPSLHPDFPAYPLRAGDYWIDSSDNHLYYWDGNAWLPIENDGGRSPIFDNTPPVVHPDYVAPDNQLEVGDIWYDTDNNFKQYIWDGVEWIAVTSDRAEAFTRFYEAVDPATYNSGNDATCALTGGATIDTITNVKLSGTDSQNKVRYLYRVNEDILIEDERNGAYAVLRVTVVNGAGDYDVELEHHNGVGNLDIGQVYAFGSAADRGAIPDVGDDTHQPGTLDDRYVNEKGGDSMEGPLQITGVRSAPGGIESTVKTLNVDSGQNSSLNLKWNGQTRVYVGDTQTSFQGHVKLNVDGGQVYAGDDTDKKGLAFYNDGVEYVGAYTEDEHVATKKNVEEAVFNNPADPDTNKYVDRTGDVMSGDLILEESSLVFTNPDGNQTLIRANRDPGVYPVILDLVNNTTVGSTFGGYDIKIGGSTAYNELRFVGQDTYLSINGGGGSQTPVKFHRDVDCGNNRFRNLGTAIDDTDAINYGQVNDTYLRLDCANDPLETELEIKTPDFGEAALTLRGKRDNINNSTATVAFKSQLDPSETYAGYLTYRTKGDSTENSFFRFNRDVDIANKGLLNAGFVQFISDGVIKHSEDNRIKFQAKSTANPGDGLVVFERPASDGRRGITIRGKDTSNNETDILWTFTNASGGDAINYNGKMSNDDNLVNKKHVDDNYAAKSHSHSNYASSSHNHDGTYVKGNFTITESNGNYYIQ